jgi:hypothetical protein
MRDARLPFVPALCALAAFGRLPAQVPHATHVVGFDTNNNAGGGTFNPANALGAPSGLGTGNGSAHTHSLGVAGWLSLGFGVTLVDGPGADFLVAENPFLTGPGRVYAELAFVEVSSNGVDFARFPSLFFGGDGSSFAINNVGFVSGLAGQTPVFANPANPNVDPQDVVEAGGDAFDLADLRSHPLVVRGLVQLAAIQHVRLVDVVSGQSADGRGRTILDPSSGSADIDALTVIHHAGNVGGRGPEVLLDIPADGNFSLTILDPDGLADLDPGSLRMSLYGQPIDPTPILGIMTLRQLSATHVTLDLGGPLPPGWFLQLGVAVKDRAGARSGQLRQRPLN